jgi:aldehyde:ferredoxin oxidoreductase
MLGNSNLAAVCRANDRCNRLGLDTISCGSTVAWAMHCYEQGLLSADDLDGLELSWGAVDGALALVEKIALREGVGDVLAMGSREAARRLGVGADLAVHVKGLEAPMHDPRGFHGLGLAYAVSNRGACHLQHTAVYVELGMSSYPEIGLEEDYAGPSSDGKARMVHICENLGAVVNSALICMLVFGTLAPADLARMLDAATGFGQDVNALLACGERIWLLKRVLNCRMGVRREDDWLPRALLTPTREGGAAGSVPEIERMMAEYYAVRGLDRQGVPARETLERVGLGWAASESQN